MHNPSTPNGLACLTSLSLVIVLLLGGPITRSHAQIVLDGSLGPRGSLTGPDFTIPAEMGQQHGSNLFHSFELFNVHSGESATFTGPDSVQNVIGRVTGPEQSIIDGLLRSDIPGANLFLFNPQGIVFGARSHLSGQASSRARCE
uniref:two-partner secretion domain-containing protein n=1 Tax=Candidatus Entotheonella palauensis TaxID=93172 RepID=UPI001177ADF7